MIWIYRQVCVPTIALALARFTRAVLAAAWQATEALTIRAAVGLRFRATTHHLSAVASATELSAWCSSHFQCSKSGRSGDRKPAAKWRRLAAGSIGICQRGRAWSRGHSLLFKCSADDKDSLLRLPSHTPWSPLCFGTPFRAGLPTKYQNIAGETPASWAGDFARGITRGQRPELVNSLYLHGRP